MVTIYGPTCEKHVYMRTAEAWVCFGIKGFAVVRSSKLHYWSWNLFYNYQMCYFIECSKLVWIIVLIIISLKFNVFML